MNQFNFQRVYFIGIGGIGMSALARYFHALGKKVSGYDKTPSALTDQLMAEGININFEDKEDAVDQEILNKKEQTLVVYTPAIPNDNRQLNFFRKEQFTIKKRAEVLGEITFNSLTVAVAGTHGKTTTSALIAHIFKSAGKNPAAFLGGIATNYNSNILLPGKEENTVIIVEADEYDRSFLTLHPNIAIITSMDPDHLDIYKEPKYLEESFNLFAGQVHENGKLFYKKGLDLKPKGKVSVESFSVNEKADHFATNIQVKNRAFYFDYVGPGGTIENIAFKMPGRHNIENAIAACAAACAAGISLADIQSALESFRGVKRRFEFIIDSSGLVFIDDYAHHPEELKACINAVKELYPDKKITGVFQPHLFSRTKDFANGFAESLDLLDSCILLEIYPAREYPIEGVNSRMLLDLMKTKEKRIVSKEALINVLKIERPEVLLTLGAGDIDRLVEPIRKELSL